MSFVEWVQVGIDVYIPDRKYQVKPHSSPCFSAAFAVAVVHRSHFFCLYQKDKSSEFIVKFRQASNCCKRVLEAAKLGSQDFWRIEYSVLNKGKSAMPPLFNCPSAFDKAKLFTEN